MTTRFKRALAVIACGAILCLTMRPAEAQDVAPIHRVTFATEIAVLLAEQDSFVAIERIESSENVDVVAHRYFDLMMELYSQRKVAEMEVVGRAGVHYVLLQARTLAGKDDDGAVRLKSLAQRMSFNLASNLWPGWKDEGITISSEQQRFGYDMARLDLRLVEELKLPSQKLSTATWIIGVHAIAAGQYAEAKERLADAKQHAINSGAQDTPLMVEGFIAIAEILEGKAAEAGRRRLATARTGLAELGTDDAKFYLQQHEDVLKVLSAR